MIKSSSEQALRGWEGISKIFYGGGFQKFSILGGSFRNPLLAIPDFSLI